MASGWALVNELFMIASSICAALGWRAIRSVGVRPHRKWMLRAAILGACFFVSYLVDSLIVGDTEFGGPRKYAAAYQLFLQIHVSLATVAGGMGIAVLWTAAKKRWKVHRRIAPWTAVMWFISAITGLAVYLLLFVLFPQGSTVKNLLHVLTGK